MSHIDRRQFLHSAAVAAAGSSCLTAVARHARAAEGDAGLVAASSSWANFRNGTSLRGIAGTTLSPTPSLIWERETADGCKATPAIIGGRAYVGLLSGDLQALDLRTGEPQWTYKSLVTDNPKTFIPGFSSPVTVTDDCVLCGDEDGTLHCVERETGEQRWVFATESLIVGGATVIDGRVVFGSHANFLYGVDLRSGEKLWEFDTKGPVNGTQVFDGPLTFVSGCSEPILYVIDTTTGQEHSQVPLDDLLIASPALIDGILYFGTSEGLVLAVDWKARQTVWKYETRQPREMHSAPAVTDKLVIIGARDKSLYALHRDKGTEAWTFTTRAGNDNSPVVVGDRAYFGSGDKFLYGVSLANGVETFKYNAGLPFADASPAIGEERLVVCTEGPLGKILCFG
jgi:outer membrane protein assembly factor BamB